MYRSDQEALHQRADAATKEADQLRRENEAMRVALVHQPAPALPTYMALPPQAIYSRNLDVRTLPVSERARLAHHSIQRFPVWAIGLLNIFTLGLFPMIHFSMMHDRLPQAAHNDPSGGKAVGFQFIPYFNLYWIFFNALRLCDRLTLQFRLRGLSDSAPRGLLMAACIVFIIPYVGLIIGLPILWTIAVCVLQSTVNKVAALPPAQWDASEPSLQYGYQQPGPHHFHMR
jgi:hypothetical protein